MKAIQYLILVVSSLTATSSLFAASGNRCDQVYRESQWNIEGIHQVLGELATEVFPDGKISSRQSDFAYLKMSQKDRVGLLQVAFDPSVSEPQLKQIRQELIQNRKKYNTKSRPDAFFEKMLAEMYQEMLYHHKGVKVLAEDFSVLLSQPISLNVKLKIIKFMGRIFARYLNPDSGSWGEQNKYEDILVAIKAIYNGVKDPSEAKKLLAKLEEVKHSKEILDNNVYPAQVANQRGYNEYYLIHLKLALRVRESFVQGKALSFEEIQDIHSKRLPLEQVMRNLLEIEPNWINRVDLNEVVLDYFSSWLSGVIVSRGFSVEGYMKDSVVAQMLFSKALLDVSKLKSRKQKTTVINFRARLFDTILEEATLASLQVMTKYLLSYVNRGESGSEGWIFPKHISNETVHEFMNVIRNRQATLVHWQNRINPESAHLYINNNASQLDQIDKDLKAIEKKAG